MGGDSFHPSNGGFSARQIVAIHRDRQHPGTVLVGVVNDKELGGVFLSENGGLNWKQRSDGFEGRDIFALGQAPTEPTSRAPRTGSSATTRATAHG